MNKNLEALLKWSTENTTPSSSSTAVTLPDGSNSSNDVIASPQAAASTSTPSTQKKLDPAVLDAILGKSDAQRMMEAVRDLKSEGVYTDEQKMDIWDELELLVENLDNANDLENMKLWQPIYDFLSHSNEDFQIQSCWVLGTAIQNNPRSQTAFRALDPLPKLLSLLSSSSSSQELRSKAMYTLSSLLRHDPISYSRFSELNGWEVLNSSLSDPSVSLRRKTVFLINSLFANSNDGQENEEGGDDVENNKAKRIDCTKKSYFLPAQKAGIADTVLRSLDPESALPTGPDGELEEIDQDYYEKAVLCLSTIAERLGGSVEDFSEEQRGRIRQVVERTEKEKKIPGDLAKEEWETFRRAVMA